MGGDDLNDVFFVRSSVFCGFPYGQCLGVAQLRESRTLVNMGNQPHCDNGEGVAVIIPPPYPLNISKQIRSIK